jgi:flavodoxin
MPGQSPARILLAFFSRAGGNYYYGGRRNLKVGNTEVLAQMIRDHIDCDVYRIEATDPYSDNYDATVARNVREQDADARPVIAGPLPPVDGYNAILLGSPVWNVRAPMIMLTFVEGLDLTGKSIFPFTTYAMSGLGSVPHEYAMAAPKAVLREGLAVQGEEVSSAAEHVSRWLRSAGLLASDSPRN